MQDITMRVVNVLSPEYYQDCHIKGSINVPLEQIEDFARGLKEDERVVFYCESYKCLASAQAWHKLHDLEIDKIWVYEGGINEWYRSDLPVEGPCSKSYLYERIAEPEDTSSDVNAISLGNLSGAMKECKFF